MIERFYLTTHSTHVLKPCTDLHMTHVHTVHLYLILSRSMLGCLSFHSGMCTQHINKVDK